MKGTSDPAPRSRRPAGRRVRLLLMVALGLAVMPAAAAARAAGGAEMQGSHVVSWGKVEVAAPPQQAFAVLTDYDRMARFLPGMLTSRVVGRDARTVVVEQTADEGFLFYRQRVTVRLAIEEFPPHRLTVRGIGGSFKELAGLYVLTRRQESTLIEYSARFVPDFELPPMVGMYAVQHSLERHLDGLAAEIRRRTAAGGADAMKPGRPGAEGDPAVAPPAKPGANRGE